MNVVLPKPVRESKETVTLSRSDWEALVELLEDAEDMAAVAARRARETSDKDARGNYLTGDELRRLLDWESPVKIWREKRRLSQRALANKAGVSPSYLAEIETLQKPGSADALLNLAIALDVPMEILVSSNRLQTSFDHLRQCIESGASKAEAIAEGQLVVAALKKHGAAHDDMSELRDRLRNLASAYGKDGKANEDNVLSAVIRDCFD